MIEKLHRFLSKFLPLCFLTCGLLSLLDYSLSSLWQSDGYPIIILASLSFYPIIHIGVTFLMMLCMTWLSFKKRRFEFEILSLLSQILFAYVAVYTGLFQIKVTYP